MLNLIYRTFSDANKTPAMFKRLIQLEYNIHFFSKKKSGKFLQKFLFYIRALYHRVFTACLWIIRNQKYATEKGSFYDFSNFDRYLNQIKEYQKTKINYTVDRPGEGRKINHNDSVVKHFVTTHKICKLIRSIPVHGLLTSE